MTSSGRIALGTIMFITVSKFVRGAVRSRVGWALACTFGVLAAPAPAAGPDLGEVVSRLPLSVDMVLAVDNGSQLRRELGEMPLMLTLTVLPRPAAIIDAWSGLAADLGMTDTEAFDLLLGRRMVIVGSNMRSGDSEEPRWALLSELDPATERKLRADLGAVPRRIVNGQPVMEFEHGSFLLATSNGRLRCKKDGTFDNTPASTLLLLAPASDRLLFEELLPLLHCRVPKSTLSQVPGGAATAAFKARDAVFLYRAPDPLHSPDRFVAANIGIEEGVWEVEALAGPATGWLHDFEPGSLDSWSPGLLDTLPPDPALVMIGSRSAVREARAWALPLVSSRLPDFENIGFEGLLGERSMFAVWLDQGAPVDAEPEVLIATAAPDLRRLIARADGYLSDRCANGSASDANARQQQTIGDFQLEPSEVRSLRVRGERVPGDATPLLNWLYVPESGANARSGADQPGWWVVHYDPTGTARTKRTDAVEAAAPSTVLTSAMPRRRYLHVGRAVPQRWAARAAAFTQPATLAREAAGTNGGPRPILLTSAIVFPQVRSVEWAVWYKERGRSLAAEISIDLRPGNERAK